MSVTFLTNKDGVGITRTVSGETIGASDASTMPPQELYIYGKTTQDGTPTFATPVNLTTVGSTGSITITIEGEATDAVQTITLSTPSGLSGIPVASNGNYTDANGQQWICDEIDFERGVHIQRVALYEPPASTDVWNKNASTNITEGLHVYQINAKYINDYYSNVKTCMCSHASYSSGWSGVDNNIYAGSSLSFTTSVYTSMADWVAFISAQKAAGTPVTVLYRLATPVETALSDAELAAYSALRTNKPNTTVTNDSGAYMQMNYIADTRTYIDNKFAELATAMVNNA